MTATAAVTVGGMAGEFAPSDVFGRTSSCRVTIRVRLGGRLSGCFGMSRVGPNRDPPTSVNRVLRTGTGTMRTTRRTRLGERATMTMTRRGVTRTENSSTGTMVRTDNETRTVHGRRGTVAARCVSCVG